MSFWIPQAKWGRRKTRVPEKRQYFAKLVLERKVILLRALSFTYGSMFLCEMPFLW